MATFEADLQALLGALVGGRCYPVVNTQPTVVSPYITFQVIYSAPLLVTDVSTGRQRARLQIDVWAATYGGAKGLAKQVKEAMDGVGAVPNALLDAQDLYEEVSKEYRALLEYAIWPA